MDLGFLLAFLLLFLLVPPLLGLQNYSTCSKEFKCINLFRETESNSPQPHSCGLCMANCDANSLPKIKLLQWPDYGWFDPWLGRLFDVVDASKSNVISLHDPTFQKVLRNKNCTHFSFDEYIPYLDSKYAIVKSITIFRCGKTALSRPETVNYFSSYEKYESCGEFSIFYQDPKLSGTQPPNEHLPAGCSDIKLPLSPLYKVLNSRNLFDLLTADFDLEWLPSDECDETCHLQVSQFKEYNVRKHLCAGAENATIDNSRKGKKNLKIITGTSIAGGTLLIALAIFLVSQKKAEGIKNSLFFRSRKSSKPSSKLDLEGGSAIYFGLPVFSYGELEEITNNFDVSKELGSGGFGIVYYGKLHDGREVAVKRLFEHNFKRMAQFLNEVEILTRLRHPNLVSLYGCTSRRSRELLLVYEYIPNGTVADHLYGDRAKDQSLTWPIRMNIAIETAGALAYLHASDIVHRDVKTNNILLDHNFQVKVADFGLSRLFPNDVSHISTAPQGTPGYLDPEYHQCYQLTNKSDVYSFGVVLIELISSMPAVDINRHRHEINLAKLAINRIQRHAFNELIDTSLGYESDPEIMRMTISVAELAFQCLQLDKGMRPTMDEVFENLKAIQDFNEDFIEMTKVTSADTDESRGRMVKFLSLPHPETELWVRGSAKTT